MIRQLPSFVSCEDWNQFMYVMAVRISEQKYERKKGESGGQGHGDG